MVITLTGPNSYMLQAELNRRIAVFVTEYTDLGLERFDGEELEPRQLPSVIQSLPFLVARRMVVLRRPSAQKVLAEQLEKLLDEVPETTDLIIVEPSLDKRTSYYKALQKKTDFKLFEELNEQSLAQWLVTEAKHQGGELSPGDARYLVQRVGLNQSTLANELQKLRHYNPQITKQAIDQLTDLLPQSSVFDLLDAAFTGHHQRVLALYQQQRHQKVEPLAILALIAWQLHILALLKTAGPRTPGDIAAQAKLSPYTIRKSLPIAQKLSLSQLKHIIQAAHTLDIRLKTQPLNADDALQHFMLTL